MEGNGSDAQSPDGCKLTRNWCLKGCKQKGWESVGADWALQRGRRKRRLRLDEQVRLLADLTEGLVHETI